MKLAETAIRFRVAVAVLMVLTLVGGLWAYLALPKEANPSIEIPIIGVTTLFPGASPEEVEALVTFPIEREMQGVEGLDEIRSTSREGLSLVFVEFQTGVSLTDANQRVRDRVDLARGDLPSEAEQPIVQEFNLDRIPVLTVNLTGTLSLARLNDIADDLQDELEGLPGVLEADVTGGVEREVHVHVDLNALQGYGLTFDQIAQAIEQENTSLPGGSIDVDRFSYQVRVDGRFDDPRIISDLVVAAPDRQPVFVRDVAEVLPEAFEDRRSYARLRELWRDDERGRPVAVEGSDYTESVSLGVLGRSGENVLDLARSVRELLDDYPFPAGVEVVITGDRSDEIALLVEEMENHIILGVLLVTLSLLFFLGLRSALLAALSIPLTMMLTFVIFLALGETLNFIVLFSLIVVLGILVDFSIVVVENIQRQAEEGYDSWEAALRAAGEVGWPVTAGLATTMVVFFPLLFWTGRTGEFMRYLPLTLLITLSSALLVALIMVPVAAGYMLRDAPASDGADGGAEAGRDGGPRRSRAPRLGRALALGTAAFVALVLLLFNPVTLLAVALLAGGMYLLYRFLLAPGTDWFRGRALPAAERRYRDLLSAALVRDYAVRRPYLRNTTALAAFLAGSVLLLVGALISALLGPRPALVALVPGGLLAVLGAIGILIHFLETVFLGREWSARIGLILMILVLPFLAARLLRGDLALAPLLTLVALPALLIGFGVAGTLFAGRRRFFLLTDNRARVLNLVVGSFLVIAVSYALAPTGAQFFPRTDASQIRVDVEAPGGTRVDASNQAAERAVQRIEQLIASDPGVERNIKNILVNVGTAGGGPFGGGLADPRRSRITLTMVDYAHRAESSTETLRKVREVLDPFPGAVVTVDQDQRGPPSPAPIEIEVTGPEFREALSLSLDVEQRLREAVASGELEGLVDLINTSEPGSPELRVQVDRARASIFGVSTAEVAGTVRAAIEGRIAGAFRRGEEEWDIRVRLREEDRQTLESLQGLRIATPDAQIPLLAMAELEEATGPGSITRVDLRPVVTLEGDVAAGRTAGDVIARTQEVIQPLRDDLPDGYSIRFAGEEEEREEAFDFLGIALLFGVALMALVLVAKFNSLVIPVVILSAVVLTMGGVVFGMITTQAPFSIMTFLAVISLAGIVADDDIVMSEFILKRAESGEPMERAIVEGGVSRFRQVVLTAVTTIIGLIPLTFGFHLDFAGLLTELRPGFEFGSPNTQFWGPLGAAVIAGLPAATLITLFFVPVVFSVNQSLRGTLNRYQGRVQEARATAEIPGDGDEADAAGAVRAGGRPASRGGRPRSPGRGGRRSD